MTLRRSTARLGREWWPEIALGAFIGFVGLCFTAGTAGQMRDSVFAVGFTVFMIALGWWMGHRHHRLPMQATLDGVRQDVSEVRDIITGAVAGMDAPDEGPERPRLKVVR